MSWTDKSGKDVVAIGELLIDFIATGIDDQGNPIMTANPGGAPCNVLSMLSRLGKKTGFIGRVGDDIFGRQLREAITSCGIEDCALAVDPSVRTTLAFVKTLEGGEREFSFYRNPGADMRLCQADVSASYIGQFRILHFGTLSSTHPENRAATRKALDIAKRAGLAISFDPNLRPMLWDSPDDARAEMLYGLDRADIVKISDDEIMFLVPDASTPIEGAERLMKNHPGIKILFATLGAGGSAALCNGRTVSAPTFTGIPAVEKTGAGDTFMGAALACLLESDTPFGMNDEALRQTLLFANAAATICASRKGALKSMPERDEIIELLRMS